MNMMRKPVLLKFPRVFFFTDSIVHLETLSYALEETVFLETGQGNPLTSPSGIVQARALGANHMLGKVFGQRQWGSYAEAIDWKHPPMFSMGRKGLTWIYLRKCAHKKLEVPPGYSTERLALWSLSKIGHWLSIFFCSYKDKFLNSTVTCACHQRKYQV